MKLKNEEFFWIMWIVFFMFVLATTIMLSAMIEDEGGLRAVVIDAGRELRLIYNEIMR